jgi:hypothetical protein
MWLADARAQAHASLLVPVAMQAVIAHSGWAGTICRPRAR